MEFGPELVQSFLELLCVPVIKEGMAAGVNGH